MLILALEKLGVHIIFARIVGSQHPTGMIYVCIGVGVLIDITVFV
jgi:hypothetical protein